MSPAEEHALMQLLLDPDPEVRGLLREQLQAMSAAQMGELAANARQRFGELPAVLAEVEQERCWQGITDELEAHNRRPTPDLLELLIALARFGRPGCDAAVLRRDVAALVARCEPQVGQAGTASGRARALARVFAEDLGFHGNTSNYYSPDNSFLDQVLARRTGIPISLSALCLVLARHLDVPLTGIGLPGHFVVGLVAPGEAVPRLFFDPFHGGMEMGRDDCLEIVQVYGHMPVMEQLRPVSVRKLFARMLNNLYASYEQCGDERRQRIITGFMRAWDHD